MQRFFSFFLATFLLLGGVFLLWTGFVNGNAGINIDVKNPAESSFDIKQTLGLKKSSDQGETKVTPFLQDIVLALTMFIGTVVSVALIVSGLFYVFASVDSGMKTKAKKGIINSLIGLVLVLGSYVIIRAIQFLATGGG